MLKVISEVSDRYKILEENCFFYVSVLQELFTHLHKEHLLSGEFSHAQRVKKLVN